MECGDIRAMVEQLVRLWNTKVAALISLAQEEGQLAAEEDPDLLASLSKYMPYALLAITSMSSPGLTRVQQQTSVQTWTRQLLSKLLKLKDGSPAWIRTTIHGSKGRCPTIRRPGKMWEEKKLLFSL